MKKVFLTILFLAIFISPSFAFLPEVVNVTKEEIKKYKDEELIMVYIDAVVERKAREAFHGKAGFAPKEYQNFKDLLMLTIRLRQEIHNRKIELPPINEWLR